MLNSMAQEYTIKNVQPREEWQSQYGAMKDYAISVDGESGWVKLTQKVETKPPQEGDSIYGTITTVEDRNGNPYKKFKKENPNYPSKGSSQQQSQANPKLDYIVKMLEELTGRRPSEDEEQMTLDDDPFKEV